MNIFYLSQAENLHGKWGSPRYSVPGECWLVLGVNVVSAIHFASFFVLNRAEVAEAIDTKRVYACLLGNFP